MIDSCALNVASSCSDKGTVAWQQPVPGLDGALVLTEMSHPCVNGCSAGTGCPPPKAAPSSTLTATGRRPAHTMKRSAPS
ncbi:hypothetical protein [Nocardia sp. NRRL S-836]|uniref:hypothetical protein n=1 Tax=Nocardia sp. NRRL S-836 TaxID=1519492 RepID=UPI0012FC4597|nr:hypothetical protein [Nocardia sp. NRRL S-836]